MRTKTTCAEILSAILLPKEGEGEVGGKDKRVNRNTKADASK